MLQIALILNLFFVGISESSERSKDKTLKGIKDEFLGKEVVLLGIKVYSSLSIWSFAKEDTREGFQRSYQNVPYKMKGTRGGVVFIGQSQHLGRKAVVDAFGEKIRDEDIVDPLINIVVRLQDGRLVMHEGYYVSILGDLELVSRFEEKREKILSKIDSMIGKTIYPMASSCIFPSDSEIDIMAEFSLTCWGHKLNIPNLTPLKMVLPGF